MEEEPKRTSPNADQLRAVIDSGAAADKVAFPDPAAAPLGTDAEAAGAAPSGGGVSGAFRTEADASRQVSSPGESGALYLTFGFIALIAASAVVTYLIFAG